MNVYTLVNAEWATALSLLFKWYCITQIQRFILQCTHNEYFIEVLTL